MKFSITLESKERLAALRTAITDTLTSYHTAESALAKMRADQPLLTESLLRLEADAPYEDEKAVATIITKRGQLELLTRKIPLAEDAVNVLPGKLFEQLRACTPVISAAVRPAFESLVKEIEAALFPHFGKGDALERAVQQSPAVVSFKNFFYPERVTAAMFSVTAAPDVLAILDDLIAGKNPWKFAVQ